MPQSPAPFVWYELMTSDAAAAEEFYKTVVGWKTQDMSQGDMKYTGLLAGDAYTTMWQIVGPHKHLEVFFGMDLWAGFEHGDVEAASGKDFGGHAAACARTDDYNVVHFWRTRYLRHAGAPSVEQRYQFST